MSNNQQPNQGFDPNQPQQPQNPGQWQGQPRDQWQGQPSGQGQQQWQPAGDQNYAQQGAYQPQGEYASSATAAGQPKKSGLNPIVLVVLGLIAAIGLGFAVWQLTKAGDPKVGDCVVVTGSGTDVEMDKDSCDDKEKVTYEVIKVAKSSSECGDESYVTQTRNDKDVKTFCIRPNLHEGVCYKEAGTGDDVEIDSACGSGSVKVVEVHNEDGASCSAGMPVEYSDPTKVFCLEPNI